MIVYGQRTADGRIAFGGRGAPYHFGSSIREGYDTEPAVHELLRRTLTELFPALERARFTHAWGGPLGIPRDWHSSVGLDRAAGTAWAGGYVGDGVSTTNLAGRTLADLITGADTDLTALPWVGPPVAAVGARAPALAGRQRRPVGHEAGGPERGPPRAPQPGGRRDGTPPRTVIGATIAPVADTASEAITKLIYTYAERIDAGDFAGVGELFAHATLTFEGFGDAVTGQDAIAALYGRTTRRYEDGTPRTKHVMTNVMVDVDDDGDARRLGAGRTSRCCRPCPARWPSSRSSPAATGTPTSGWTRSGASTTMHIIIDLVGDLGHHMLFDLAP